MKLRDAIVELYECHTILSMNVHVDLQVSRVVVTDELESVDSVTAWSEVKVVDTVCDKLSAKMDRVLLLKGLLFANLVDLEHQLASV